MAGLARLLPLITVIQMAHAEEDCVDYRYVGSYDGFCQTANCTSEEDYFRNPFCYNVYQARPIYEIPEITEPWSFNDPDELALTRAFCSSHPTCLGYGLHYNVRWFYLARDLGQPASLLCPDYENNRCGNGQVTAGCHVKVQCGSSTPYAYTPDASPWRDWGQGRCIPESSPAVLGDGSISPDAGSSCCNTDWIYDRYMLDTMRCNDQDSCTQTCKAACERARNDDGLRCLGFQFRVANNTCEFYVDHSMNTGPENGENPAPALACPDPPTAGPSWACPYSWAFNAAGSGGFVAADGWPELTCHTLEAAAATTEATGADRDTVRFRRRRAQEAAAATTEAVEYMYFASGSCTAAGWSLITSTDHCKAAARAVGFTHDCGQTSGTYAGSPPCTPNPATTTRPSGCYGRQGSGYAHFNQYLSSDLGARSGYGYMCMRAAPTTPPPAPTSCTQIGGGTDGQHTLRAEDGSTYATRCSFFTAGGKTFAATLVGRVSIEGTSWTYPTSGYDGVGDDSGSSTPWESTSTFGTLSGQGDFKNPGWWSAAGSALRIDYNGEFLLQTEAGCLAGGSLGEKLAGLSWDAAGSQSVHSAPAAHRCARDTSMPAQVAETTEALGQEPPNILLQWGERNGAQDGNRDRVYISSDGAAGTNVDAPQGLGSFMSGDGVGAITSVNVGANNDRAVSVGGSGFYDLWVVEVDGVRLLSGATPLVGGGSAGEQLYVTPSGWTVETNNPVYNNGALYWLSNVVDGSTAGDTSTCSGRDSRYPAPYNSQCYWLGRHSCSGSTFLSVRMEQARCLSHVLLEPAYRGVWGNVTGFRVLGDSSDFTPLGFGNMLANYNAAVVWPSTIHHGDVALPPALRIEIGAVVQEVSLVDIVSSGHCGFGEITLVACPHTATASTTTEATTTSATTLSTTVTTDTSSTTLTTFTLTATTVTTATATSISTTATSTGTSTTTLTTYTSTSTATTTATSTTNTATATWPLVANCTLDRLLCPIPRALVNTEYVVLGHPRARTGEPCGPPPRVGSEPPMFNIDVAACNVTVQSPRTAGHVTLSATLVPKPGTLVFTAEPLATLICTCKYDTDATVSFNTVVVIDVPNRNIDGAGSNLSAALGLFPDDTFSEALPPGGAFPETASRFYLEVSAGSESDVIGVPQCSASPSGDEGDEFTQFLWDDYCAEPIFGAEQLSGPGVDDLNHTVRFSVTKFKFRGFPSVHLSCQVVRCRTPPCGTCSDRRLGRGLGEARRGLQEGDVGTVALDFVVPPGRYLVLPGLAPEAEAAAARGSTNASSTAAQVASETPGVATIAMVVAATVLVIVVAAIGAFVMWRLMKRRKGSALGAAEGAGSADAATKEGAAQGSALGAAEGAGTADAATKKGAAQALVSI